MLTLGLFVYPSGNGSLGLNQLMGSPAAQEEGDFDARIEAVVEHC